jgi:hypothetical protein
MSEPIGGYSWVLEELVYMGGTKVIRRLTTKEKGQILDIREDWGNKLAKGLWKQGEPLPCRIPAEVLRGFAAWASPIEISEQPRREIARNVLRTGEEDPDLVLRSRAGLFWEPGEATEVSVAAKSDNAETDLSMWALGGSSQKMVWARSRLHRAMHYWWLKQLKKEAYQWLACRPKTDTAQESRRREDETAC